MLLLSLTWYRSISKKNNYTTFFSILKPREIPSEWFSLGHLWHLSKRNHSTFVAVLMVPLEPCESGGKPWESRSCSGIITSDSGRQQLDQVLIKLRPRSKRVDWILSGQCPQSMYSKGAQVLSSRQDRGWEEGRGERRKRRGDKVFFSLGLKIFWRDGAGACLQFVLRGSGTPHTDRQTGKQKHQCMQSIGTLKRKRHCRLKHHTGISILKILNRTPRKALFNFKS